MQLFRKRKKRLAYLITPHHTHTGAFDLKEKLKQIHSSINGNFNVFLSFFFSSLNLSSFSFISVPLSFSISFFCLPLLRLAGCRLRANANRAQFSIYDVNGLELRIANTCQTDPVHKVQILPHRVLNQSQRALQKATSFTLLLLLLLPPLLLPGSLIADAHLYVRICMHVRLRTYVRVCVSVGPRMRVEIATFRKKGNVEIGK